MVESVTIARPYAQAVFLLAQEKDVLAEWSARLERLATIASAPEIERVISHPKISVRQVIELFSSLSGEPENRELISFIKELAENRRFGVLADIRTVFESLKNENEGVKEAVIASASPIAEKHLSTLLKALEAYFGRRLRERVEVDASLIGGVRVTVGDQVLDASVRGKLDAMAVALKSQD